MAKGDQFFYDNLSVSASFSKTAALYLVQCLENYDPANLQEMLTAMHEIEHGADSKKHEMGAALAKAFVTPVDREDLDMLSHQIDDVTDTIEEILQKFYIYDVHEILPEAVVFAKNLVRACELLGTIMQEFGNFRKSQKLRKLIIELNDVEEECDKLYLDSMRALMNQPENMLLIMSWREIFGCFEACADACEHASECVASVIMKNT